MKILQEKKKQKRGDKFQILITSNRMQGQI